MHAEKSKTSVVAQRQRRKGPGMSGRGEHRARSVAMWREVMQAEPPPVTDAYMEGTTDHLMGRVWTRPGLARRDRRFVTLTIAAATSQGGPFGIIYVHRWSLVIFPSRNSTSGSSTSPTTGVGQRPQRPMPLWAKSPLVRRAQAPGRSQSRKPT
jgi:hypothetical protein